MRLAGGTKFAAQGRIVVAKLLAPLGCPDLARPQVLVADDDPAMRQWLQLLLRQRQYEVTAVENGRAAIACIATRKPDLIILDMDMPELDGFGVIAHLRASDETQHIPILVLSGLDDASLRVAGLDCGANDYLTKPVDSAELLARVRAHLRVSEVTQKLRADCLRDTVTGLASRRGVIDVLRREVARAMREKSPLALLYLDLDGFKAVNDRFGHRTGDEILASFGRLLAKLCRKGDIAGRMGGDEFALILPGVGRAGALQVSERVTNALADQDVHVTIRASIGIALLFDDVSPAEPDPVTAMLHAADSAMYADKRLAALQRRRGRRGV